MRKYKQFGYGSILCSFFLERVPMVKPHMSTPFTSLKEPKMHRWIYCMAHLGGGLPMSTFNQDFFD
jgi:hypothetical protein